MHDYYTSSFFFLVPNFKFVLRKLNLSFMTMFFLNALVFLCFLSFNFFVHAQLENVFLGHDCFGPIDFPEEEVYVQISTHWEGFLLAIVGRRRDNQTVYELTQCWGSNSSPHQHTSCRRCIEGANQEVRSLCAHQSGAIIWYTQCFLKYLNKDFLCVSDTDSGIFVLNSKLVNAPLLFSQHVHQLLIELRLEAPKVKHFFAHGNFHLPCTRNLVIYGAAQCTKDLSSIECKKCLDVAITDFPNNSFIMSGIGFELYPFLE